MYNQEQNTIFLNQYKEFFNPSLETLEKELKLIFPNAFVNCSIKQSIGPGFVLTITFRLISNSDEFINEYAQNDPCGITFLSYLKPAICTKDTNIVLELIRGGLRLKPDVGSYNAMKIQKTSFRKSTGTIDKQVQKLIKFFKQVGEDVLSNKDNFYAKIPEKYFEIYTSK
jgi:hypothetical protein